jgi:hypothetical protein
MSLASCTRLAPAWEGGLASLPPLAARHRADERGRGVHPPLLATCLAPRWMLLRFGESSGRGIDHWTTRSACA